MLLCCVVRVFVLLISVIGGGFLCGMRLVRIRGLTVFVSVRLLLLSFNFNFLLIYQLISPKLPVNLLFPYLHPQTYFPTISSTPPICHPHPYISSPTRPQP